MSIIASILSLIRNKIEQGLTWIALNLVYFIGIGFSAVIGKLFGKNFLFSQQHDSNWQQFKDSDDLERMF